jgi:hypothetical protein
MDYISVIPHMNIRCNVVERYSNNNILRQISMISTQLLARREVAIKLDKEQEMKELALAVAAQASLHAKNS